MNEVNSSWIQQGENHVVVKLGVLNSADFGPKNQNKPFSSLGQSQSSLFELKAIQFFCTFIFEYIAHVGMQQ